MVIYSPIWSRSLEQWILEQGCASQSFSSKLLHRHCWKSSASAVLCLLISISVYTQWFEPFYKYLSFVGGDVAKTYLDTATINKVSQHRALNLKQTAWRRWGQTFFMKHEQAFDLKPNTEGVFDTEKSKEQVEILDSIHLPWLLQVFSTLTDVFKCVSSFH